jgi:hypothetical protein
MIPCCVRKLNDQESTDKQQCPSGQQYPLKHFGGAALFSLSRKIVRENYSWRLGTHLAKPIHRQVASDPLPIG